MKILQVCNKPPFPPRDGGSLAMFNLSKALRDLGQTVTVITMFTGKHRLTPEQLQQYNKMMEVHPVYVDSALSLRGLILNLLFSGKPYTASRFYSDNFRNKLVELLKNGTYDIVQLEGLYLTQYIEDIRKHSGALIALRAHNVEHEIWTRTATEESNILRKVYFSHLAKRIKRFELKALNRYDLLIPITERDNAQFKRLGNIKPSHVCPAGVNVKQHSGPSSVNEIHDQKPGAFTIFYLGSLDWIPNQEGLLWFIAKVFPKLRQQYPDLRLHIAGRNAPKSLIKKLDLPGIVFHGEIDDPDEFTREHTVLIAPCFSGSGMRLKIIEAMALGKPVVTTTIGAEGLDIINGEHLMIADDSNAFIGCIERLIKYPDICRQIGRNAYRLVYERYNNCDLAASLAEFYNQQLT